ncbi:MAG: hypothetical protein ABW105_03755 [Candidatus Thiodiazotropha sp. 6PLUC1]
MSETKPIIIRIWQAIQRRIRHQRILFFARRSSSAAISSVKQLDRVLVLCYGNIYRSPLVEYLLRRQLAGEKVELKSAGFHEKDGRSCVEEYLGLLSKRGYDLTAHRSSRVTHDDIEWADVIVIMDRKNWDLMKQMDQSAIQKIIWVGGFTNNMSVEVVDPYGLGVEATEKVISQLEIGAGDIANKIVEKRSSLSSHIRVGGSA